MIKQKQIFFSIALIYISLQIVSSQKITCSDIYPILFQDLESIIDYIDNNIYYLKQNPQQCIDLLVKNGRFEALDYFLDELDTRRINYRKGLASTVNALKTQLEEVHDKHRNEVVQYQTLSPAFQWAQSLEDVFIEIKFAHRHDSPGCLEIQDKDIDIQEKYVSFTGFCTLGDVPIKINFSIITNKKINYAKSTHEAGSVGRYRFNLKKEKPGYWESLLAIGEPVPTNMRVWFEMKEKYQEELKKFEEKKEDPDEYNKIVDEINEQRKDKKKKEKKKKSLNEEGVNSNKTDTNDSNTNKNTNNTTN